MSELNKNKTSKNLNELISQTKQIQDDFTSTLRGGIDYVLNRGEKLDVLITTADDLNTSSDQLCTVAKRARERLQKQNHKNTIFTIALVVIVVGLVVLSLAKSWN